MNGIKNICIIETGGTIACLSDHPESEFYSKPSQDLSSILRELSFDDAHIVTEIFSQKMSHHFTFEDLLGLSYRIQSLVDDEYWDGIVVTMGTNALEEIAYFLGLVVKTQKPIVVTGAHFSQNSLCFDGKKNLFNAIKITLSHHAIGIGVLVTFNDYVVTARDAIKTTPGSLDNFLMDGNGLIGHVIGGNFVVKSQPLYRHTYLSQFNIKDISYLPNVSIIYGHLGMDDSLVNVLISKRVSGIISVGFGKGYQSEIVAEALFKAVINGVFVVRCSRIGMGYTTIDNHYDNKYGFIVSGLSPNKSHLLLSLAILQHNNADSIQKIFEQY